MNRSREAITLSTLHKNFKFFFYAEKTGTWALEVMSLDGRSLFEAVEIVDSSTSWEISNINSKEQTGDIIINPESTFKIEEKFTDNIHQR